MSQLIVVIYILILLLIDWIENIIPLQGIDEHYDGIPLF